jgi:hypothetical protein
VRTPAPLAAVQEPEHLHGVRGREHVGIAGDDEGRRGDTRDLRGESEVLLRRLPNPAQEPWPVLRPRGGRLLYS